jgi:hypothetical protein
VKLAHWGEFPRGVQIHLSDRLRDRNITADDLDKLRVWIESEPLVPDGDWYKDFGSFKICGSGPFPTTFLSGDQAAWGHRIDDEAQEVEA